MKNFSNIEIKKTFQKYVYIFYIGLVLLVFMAFFIGWRTLKKETIEYTLVENVIQNIKKTDTPVSFEVSKVFPSFAHYNEDSSEFYLIENNKGDTVIAKLKKETYNELSLATEENPILITGVTTYLPRDIRTYAIEKLNEILKENRVNNNNYSDYFGVMYIDEEGIIKKSFDWILILILILGITGSIILLSGLTNMIRFRKKIRKMSKEEILKLDEEMNSKDSFYYSKAHLYLTPNFIISFSECFEVIPYQEILWVYEHNHAQYGFIVKNSIILKTKDGKNHVIANLDGLTKKAKEVFEEILQTIEQKSPLALKGYSKENQKLIKNILKRKTNL